MKLADLKKKLKVVVTQKGYYENKIYDEGEVLMVPRQFFSTEWMVAVDEKGEPLEEQPEKLNTKEVRKLLKMKDQAADDLVFPTIGSNKGSAKALI